MSDNNPDVVQVVEEIIEATDGMDVVQVAAAVLESLRETGWVVLAKADVRKLMKTLYDDGQSDVSERIRKALA